MDHSDLLILAVGGVIRFPVQESTSPVPASVSVSVVQRAHVCHMAQLTLTVHIQFMMTSHLHSRFQFAIAQKQNRIIFIASFFFFSSLAFFYFSSLVFLSVITSCPSSFASFCVFFHYIPSVFNSLSSFFHYSSSSLFSSFGLFHFFTSFSCFFKLVVSLFHQFSFFLFLSFFNQFFILFSLVFHFVLTSVFFFSTFFPLV